MKFIKYFIALGLICFVSLDFAAETNEENVDAIKVDLFEVLYKSAKLHINVLKEKADKGDMACAFAYYDFYESLKNPSYKITFSPSKKILSDRGLLDRDGNLHDDTRKVFEIYEQISKPEDTLK